MNGLTVTDKKIEIIPADVPFIAFGVDNTTIRIGVVISIVYVRGVSTPMVQIESSGNKRYYLDPEAVFTNILDAEKLLDANLKRGQPNQAKPEDGEQATDDPP